MKNLIFITFLLLGFSSSFAFQANQDTISSAMGKQEHFDVNASVQNYLDTLSPVLKEKSDAYYEGNYWIQVWNIILELFVAWIFLSLGLSKWIKGIIKRRFSNINIQNLAYILFYLLLAFMLTFPFTIYTDFFREHQYNLSNMNFGDWLGDQLLNLVLNLILLGLFLTLLYMIIRKVKQNWWIWGSSLTIVFLIFIMFISPLYINPLFNDYTPLPEGKLKEEILSMAKANGIAVDNVYQVNASRQGTQISANVSGFGKTMRISLNDNLLNKCTPAEIKSIMAHEMGHYLLNHTFKLIVYIGILIIIGFAVVNWLFKKALLRFGSKWGISDISDIGGLPLFMVLFMLFLFIATPAINNIIRSVETESDIFGLNVAREPDAFASVAMKLAEYRKINPGKLEEIIFFDHPSGKARVLMAMKWKSEQSKDK
jgi:STE24 endopeptidase